MYREQVTVQNKSGLHARPASTFVSRATQFQSRITIRNVEDPEPVNAKSIILLLSTSLSKGTRVEIAAEGPDENEAVVTLVELIKSGLGEDL